MVNNFRMTKRFCKPLANSQRYLLFPLAQHFPGQSCVKLAAVRDSEESSWTLSATARSKAEQCPEQRGKNKNAFRDRAKSRWVLSRQHWAQLSALRDSAESNGELSRTVHSYRDSVESLGPRLCNKYFVNDLYCIIICIWSKNLSKNTVDAFDKDQ